MKTTIPFSGFYESIHSHAIDNAIEQDCEHYGIDCDDYMMLPDYSWEDIKTKYASEYVQWFNGIVADFLGFDAGLTFESLASPRFYNFETDRIFCDITEENARRVLRAVPHSAFVATIRERFTSRSGFIPHYSNRIEDWTGKPFGEWDHNEIGTIFQALVEHCLEGFDEWDAAEELSEVIFNALPCPPERSEPSEHMPE